MPRSRAARFIFVTKASCEPAFQRASSRAMLLPEGINSMMSFVNSFHARVLGYLVLLTDDYPPIGLEAARASSSPAPPAPPAPPAAPVA